MANVITVKCHSSNRLFCEKVIKFAGPFVPLFFSSLFIGLLRKSQCVPTHTLEITIFKSFVRSQLDCSDFLDVQVFDSCFH